METTLVDSVNTEVVSQEVGSIRAHADMLVVVSEKDYSFAAEFVLQIKGKQKLLNETFDGNIKRWFDGHKSAVAQKKEFEKPLKDALLIVDTKMFVYQQEEERRRRVEEARLQADGQKKLEDEQLQIAQSLTDAGDHQGAEAVLCEDVIAPAVILPVAVPKIEGYSLVDHWIAIIDNANLIPCDRKYMSPDITKLNALARIEKGKSKVPGVKFVNLPVSRGRLK